jgi:ATP-dependent DNA ligase
LAAGGIAKKRRDAYVGRMFKSFEFCLPAAATAVPSGPDWLHEVKYDGYRLRVERDGDRARLITRGGDEWIAEAALKRCSSALSMYWPLSRRSRRG